MTTQTESSSAASIRILRAIVQKSEMSESTFCILCARLNVLDNETEALLKELYSPTNSTEPEERHELVVEEEPSFLQTSWQENNDDEDWQTGFRGDGWSNN